MIPWLRTIMSSKSLNGTFTGVGFWYSPPNLGPPLLGTKFLLDWGSIPDPSTKIYLGSKEEPEA